MTESDVLRIVKKALMEAWEKSGRMLDNNSHYRFMKNLVDSITDAEPEKERVLNDIKWRNKAMGCKEPPDWEKRLEEITWSARKFDLDDDVVGEEDVQDFIRKELKAFAEEMREFCHEKGMASCEYEWAVVEALRKRGL